jgi:hypothetical protein
LLAPPKDRVLAALMDSAVSTFVTLFRHGLIALGEDPPLGARDVVGQVAEHVGVRPDAFWSILELREGRRTAAALNVRETLRGFLELVEHVTDEVDRRLAGIPSR